VARCISAELPYYAETMNLAMTCTI